MRKEKKGLFRFENCHYDILVINADMIRRETYLFLLLSAPFLVERKLEFLFFGWKNQKITSKIKNVINNLRVISFLLLFFNGRYRNPAKYLLKLIIVLSFLLIQISWICAIAQPID